MRCVLLLSFGLGLLGCAKAADTGNPFGTSPVPSNDDSGDSSDTDADTDADTDTGETGAGTGGISASGGDGSTGGGGDDGSTGMADPSTTTDDSTSGTTDTTSTSTTGGPGAGQPMDGMYSHCDDADGMQMFPSCINGATTCLNTVTDGFCTAVGCLNPAADCDAVPTDATAAAICMTDTVGGNAFCALDCSAGQTCPAGMVCTPDLTLDDGASVFTICL